MIEEDKKLLTKYLGERWHAILNTVQSIEYGTLCKCSCGAINCEKDAMHRTFTTWQDLGDLKEKLVEKDIFDSFGRLAINRWAEKLNNKETSSNYVEWLLNPARFCQLVADWRKENP